ncbi:MAG: D-cysteine desulfhydrase family protein [Candidatus Riflebacteria bacterium HGW-Riflebacteria-2]|jgi:D-cysteine desulfhydrase|nr:MAG: D-cysteine desulfhydrase family protein [Candidatus Riflebacteria bacterium HGW-Riflebacteria-2]
MKHLELPREPLGFFPTPVHELANLGRALGGPRIFIKRDDQTGLAFGGNKTRKLEYIIGRALAQGADTLITAGAGQSNHCRQTAAAAASLNMACHLVLGGSAPETANGNLLLDQLLGAQIHWAGKHRKGEDIPKIEEELRKAGRQPFVVPYGGSNELGATGFVEALCELDSQTFELQTDFDHIVFASSSGGTQAGLMVGKKLLKKNYEITGIAIDKEGSAEKSLSELILDLANSTASYLETGFEVDKSDLILNEEYTGAGYGIIGEAEKEAIRLTAKHEGILLDPVYTGRAMAGLIGLIRQGRFKKDEAILFWHTGGAPALFASAEELQN